MMKPNPKSLILICFTLLTLNGVAQEFSQDSTISISGFILSDKEKEPIEDAIITIKRTRRGVISDSSGVFHLQILPKDTLVISSMGFEMIQWPVPAIADPNFPPFFKIYLKNQAVPLKEVNVYALGTYEDFKEEFVKKKLPPKKKKGEGFRLSEAQMFEIKLKEQARTPPNVVAGLIGLGSKIFKKKKKPQPVFSNEVNFVHQQMLQEKFNREIVTNLTGETGNTLEQVYAYIYKNSNFTYQDSELDIQTKILELYKEYKLDPEKANSSLLQLKKKDKIPNHLRP
ncbi:carboxypeptidase-like regulatory domain-containing protein [Marinifilum flexuosum]|uniref:carboxypeptidase-like regulatory domain-containing protein n=1 Tax=Marinifilum flexuosum TaxID=1117708 RepID=UPI002492EDDA|nr:carboxypeptidase-like regulatory domain-containing protein [Marinifilum flexuosum]